MEAHEKILFVSGEVRRHIEEIADDQTGWSKDCHDGVMSLQGACAYASRVLVRVLASQGLSSRVCVGWFDGIDHCWVDLPDYDVVIDVTATQFKRDFPRVRIFVRGADPRYVLRISGLPASYADSEARRFDAYEYLPPIRETSKKFICSLRF